MEFSISIDVAGGCGVCNSKKKVFCRGSRRLKEGNSNLDRVCRKWAELAPVKWL